MAKIRGASCYGEYLEQNLSYGDYMAEENRVKGEWAGALSARFGLEGRDAGVDDERFRNLVDGLNPNDGGRLTQRARSKDDEDKAVRIFDFQCSAQKSVSVMALTLGDTRLVEAHERAVKLALGELEKFTACRVRDGEAAWSNDTRLTGNLCAAIFRHESSRALDPQLHSHCAVFNVTWDEQSERYLALTESEMVKAIRYGGKVYQSAMALECQRLGYEIELAVNQKGIVEGFEIKEVSPEIRERFSKRSPAIEAAIAQFTRENGHEPSRAELAIIKRQTRDEKMLEIGKAEVTRQQLAQLSRDEREQLETLKSRATQAHSIPFSPTDARETVERAVAHLYERHSVLSRHQVLAEALNEGLGRVDLASVLGAADDAEQNHELVTLEAGGISLTDQLATREGLAAERWAVDFVNQTQRSFLPLLPPDQFEQRLAEAESSLPGKLREDQFAAARLICTNEDQVAAVRGVAGAGKTFMLQAVDKMLRSQGAKLIYLAPTASAAKVLTKDGLQARTCASFLLNPGDCKNAVIICDEAGLQSNADGVALLRKAEAKGARVVFVGDTRQHVAVSAGDFLRVLETHSRLQSVEVATIERQKTADYKAAVVKLSVGDPIGGLETLDSLGWIHEGQGRYLENAAASFLARTDEGADLSKCLVVCPTWAENHVVTDAIRAGLRERGRLGDGVTVEVRESLNFTLQQKRSAKHYQPGMVVTFHKNAAGFAKGESVLVVAARPGAVHVQYRGRTVRLPLVKASAFDVGSSRRIEIAPGDRLLIRANHKKLGLVNGDLLNVRAVHPDGRIETIEGKEIPPSFREFAHGFVVTSHKSQGQTFEHVVAAGERFDSKAAYVALSRGKFSATVHTPDKERLLQRNRPESLRKLPTGDRLSALDVVQRQHRADEILVRMRARTPLPDRLKAWQRSARAWAARQQRRVVRLTRRVPVHVRNWTARRLRKHILTPQHDQTPFR